MEVNSPISQLLLQVLREIVTDKHKRLVMVHVRYLLSGCGDDM